MKWEKEKASKFCSYVTDGTHDSPKAQSRGRKLITSKHLKGYFIDFDSANWISEEDYQKIISRSPIEQWDVLYSMIGTIGNIYIEKNPNVDYACKNVGIFKFAGRIDDAYWVYYYLKSFEARKYINSHLRGSTQSYVPLGSLRDIPVPVPSASIRKHIVDVLKMLDDKIALNTAINKNLEEQARAIFKKWISNCSSFTTIGDLAENVLDYTPNPNSMVKLLNSSDVTEGVFPNANYVLNENLKGHFKKRFKCGDILYSEIRPRNHHYGYVLFDASDYIASTRLMIIRAVPNIIYPALLYQYLLLPKVESEFVLKTESRSGTFPQGNYADMASIEVPFMPFSEQGEIADVLSQVRNIIAKNQRENECLVALRDALLPKLMSGELDVSALAV